MKVLSGLPALDAPERHMGIGAGTTPTRSPVFPLAELEEARVLAMNLAQPNAAVAASMGKARSLERLCNGMSTANRAHLRI